MTETLIRAAAVADTALADAIDTLTTLTLASRHLPPLASIELSFDTYDGAWHLRAQISPTPTEADDIDAVRTWADALTGGQTHLTKPYNSLVYRFRTLSATGTLAGSTPVEAWTHIDKATGTEDTDES